MEPAGIEECRRNYLERQKRRRDDQEERRLRLLRAVREAARSLQTLGVERVLLYGSILIPHRFHERSDLDIVVYGLPAAKWTAAFLALENWPGLDQVAIDMKPGEDLPVDFLSFVEARGEVIIMGTKDVRRTRPAGANP
ncbi:MAG: hypothetical protein A2521_17520 [Deltaproteobacteria bacterium RIFOXYD12_FULL_57_12]|nr:MAG: hypothetical protein A2521_17520 [Deltaproteobacteria bacterium RIFOXYD12_FULL_57_12]